jgi:cation:H+ antiporter
VVLLAGLRLSIGGAMLLFGLFIGQFLLPLCSQWFPSLAFGLGAKQIHPVFCILYAVVAVALFLQNPRSIWRLKRGLNTNHQEEEQPLTPHCEKCRFRLVSIGAKASH